MGILPNPDSLDSEYHPSTGSSRRTASGAQSGQRTLRRPVTVRLEAPVPESAVYYTLDGADPTVDGQEYTAPLAVTETTVLRAVALRDGVPVSAVTTATYLVGEGTGLPVRCRWSRTRPICGTRRRGSTPTRGAGAGMGAAGGRWSGYRQRASRASV